MDGPSDRVCECQRRRRDTIVGWERVVGGGHAGDGRAAVLVRQQPLVRGGEEGDDGHARPGGVGRVCDVVNGVGPRDQVRGGLVHELLAVTRVALVRVEADQLRGVEEEEGLPDGRDAVVRDRGAAGRDVRGEGPGEAGVGAGVEVELSGGEVGRDGVAGEEDRVRGEVADGFGKQVQKGLVAEAPVVGLVGDAGDFVPGHGAVGGLVDGEVDERGFGAVVFPRREQGAVGELERPRVQGAWDGVVGRGLEDGVVVEGGEGRGCEGEGA